MEGGDQSGRQHHLIGGGIFGGAFGPPLPRPPNQKPGIPPSHPDITIQVPPTSTSIPYPQFSPQSLLRSPSSSSGSPGSSFRSPGYLSHSRSLSQPPVFSLDSLPPLNPSHADLIPISTDVMSVNENPTMSVNRGVHSTFQVGGASVTLPPRKGHRRTSSDSPFKMSDFIQSSPSSSGAEGSTAVGNPIHLKLKATNSVQGGDGFMNGRKEVVVATDDSLNHYMNLENIDNMNFYGDKDLDSRTSGSKTVGGSDNEIESHVDRKTNGAYGPSSSFIGERREGLKRSSNGDIAPASRHRRGFSLDSSIESGLFTDEEMKKIMENDKLVGMALVDPKHTKRVLANRRSAARSKERKTQYISELEQKVETLQTETTTLSTEITKLQREMSELRSENKEYKLRLQANEQQSQLKDALIEALNADVRHLRHAVADPDRESLTNAMARQLAINQQRFQLQQQHQQQPNQQQRHFAMQILHPHQDVGESQTRSQQRKDLNTQR